MTQPIKLSAPSALALQTLDLADDLTRYAPCIIDTQWSNAHIDVLVVDALRIDSNALPCLAQTCLVHGITLAIVNDF